MDREITNGSTSNGDHTGSGMSGEVRTAPLIAIPVGGGDGNLKSSGSFLSIVSDHVMISALKMAEKGNGLILRLYEDQNRRGPVKVTFFHPPSRAVECDPYENEIDKADIVSGSLRFDIKPFEVRTFKLSGLWRKWIT